VSVSTLACIRQVRLELVADMTGSPTDHCIDLCYYNFDKVDEAGHSVLLSSDKIKSRNLQ
jgi:hypothetical protein